MRGRFVERLINSLYYNLRRNDLKEATEILWNMPIIDIYMAITKECWKYNIQYETIEKKEYKLALKLKGSNESVILVYEKLFTIEIKEFYNFLCEIEDNECDRGVYIALSGFSDEVINSAKEISVYNNFLLIDLFKFCMDSIGWRGNVKLLLNPKKINFDMYFPQ